MTRLQPLEWRQYRNAEGAKGKRGRKGFSQESDDAPRTRNNEPLRGIQELSTFIFQLSKINYEGHGRTRSLMAVPQARDHKTEQPRLTQLPGPEGISGIETHHSSQRHRRHELHAERLKLKALPFLLATHFPLLAPFLNSSHITM